MSLSWHKWEHYVWLSSETRHSMTLAERGLYRDCLDLHYGEGSIPANPDVLRRSLGLDKGEFEAVWDTVSKHFFESPTDPTRLLNKKASKVLQRHNEYSEGQAERGRRGGINKSKSTTSGSESKRLANAKQTPGKRLAKGKQSPSHKETETETDTPIPPKGDSWGDRFDEWWEAWPKKTAKPDARKAYLKLVVDGKVKPEQRDDLAPYPDFESRHEQLVRATAAWAPEFARRDIDKVPYPATFLNKLDWLSAPATANSANGTPTLTEAQARLKRTKLSIDSDQRMAWESVPQWHERLRKLGWPIPS